MSLRDGVSSVHPDLLLPDISVELEGYGADIGTVLKGRQSAAQRSAHFLRFRPSKFGMADHIAVAVHLSPILGAGTKHRGNCGQTDKVVTNYNLYVIFKRS